MYIAGGDGRERAIGEPNQEVTFAVERLGCSLEMPTSGGLDAHVAAEGV